MEDTQYNKKLAIIGAGGLGRETESWVRQVDLFKEYELIGFLDDIYPKETELTKLEIIDKVNLPALEKAENVIFGLINIEAKQKVIELYKKHKSFNILSLVHYSVIFGDLTDLGIGFYASPKVLISCNTKIGDGVFINCGSQIGHDVSIGDHTNIMANVDIGGGAVIGDNVFIGSGAIVLPGIKVASNVRIGAGSIVIKNIKKEGTYFGNPAKMVF